MDTVSFRGKTYVTFKNIYFHTILNDDDNNNTNIKTYSLILYQDLQQSEIIIYY
jgi:hypothetical protein